MKKQFNNPKFYNQTIPANIEIPNVPMSAVIKSSAKYFGNRAAYIYQGNTITYEEIYTGAKQLANALATLGYKKGDVIAVHMPNCNQYPIIYYAILMLGCTYTPINPMSPRDTILFQLKDSGAVGLFTYKPLLPQCEQVQQLTKVRHIIATDDMEGISRENIIDVAAIGENIHSFNALVQAYPATEMTVDIDCATHIAHIAYTGGTTGHPKGVMTTHKNLVSNITQSAAWSGVLTALDADGDIYVRPILDEETYNAEYKILPGTNRRISPAPFAHGAGAMGGLGFSVLLGATTYILQGFNPEEYLRTIEEEQITELSGAPALFNYLLFHPHIETRNLSSVQIINSAAAPIADESMKLLVKYFPNATVTEGYGLTEATASTVQSVVFHSGTRKLGTVGLPIYNTELSLRAIGSDEEITVPGERGEIVIKGPQVMRGYLNNQEETDEVLRDGWLYTGDIGVVDEDGFLAIVDRKKDMILYNGYNVYPRQIEEILYSHPDVQAAAVVGVEDTVVGEKPKAYVVRKQGGTVTEDALMQFVNEKVVHYSKVRELVFLEELPMTAAGKISKVMLIQQAQEQTP